MSAREGDNEILGESLLGDVGEYRLIESIVLPNLDLVSLPSAKWSDACSLDVPKGCELVITTDAAPKPATWYLGNQDYRTFGWYAVISNVSDLAAAGADPLVGVTSVDAPPTMTVYELAEFFRGVSEAMMVSGIRSAGGNLRQAPLFSCHGAFLGFVPIGNAIGRKGALPGDKIVCVGPLGVFGAALVEARLKGIGSLSNVLHKALFRPRSQVGSMARLRKSGVVHAASDASDGVLRAISNIAAASGVSAVIEFDEVDVPQETLRAAEIAGCDVLNLMTLWGSWQVIVAIPAAEASRVLSEEPSSAVLGHFESADTRKCAVYGELNGESRAINVLGNEGFTRNSLSTDFDRHLDYMISASIWKEAASEH